MRIYQGAEELEKGLGEELGPSDWFVVDQERINGFADFTEDHQWIHVDPERAASGPFGAPIAHGFLTLSLLPYLSSQLRQIEGARMSVNYGLNKVRFPNPVRVGSRIRALATVTEVERTKDGAIQLVLRTTIEIEGASKPACVAEMVSRHYFD